MLSIGAKSFGRVYIKIVHILRQALRAELHDKKYKVNRDKMCIPWT